MNSERITDHPVLGTPPGKTVRLVVNGTEIEALNTDTVAGALWVNGQAALRSSRSGDERGMYCGIGNCFECRVVIDSEPGVRACLAKVEPGLRVETAVGRDARMSEDPDWSEELKTTSQNETALLGNTRTTL